MEVELEIDISIFAAIKRSVTVTAGLGVFDIFVAENEVFKTVVIVEMITEYFSVFLDYEVAAIGIVMSSPCFGRHHSEGS